MKTWQWLLLFSASALAGVALGYFITLLYRPNLLPPVFRVGGISAPTTVLLLGVDVVYTRQHRGVKADATSFSGRSDTIMVARFDPYQNRFGVLSIPRDTMVAIPGHGRQKINGANALGGPALARETVENLTGIPIDHYLVLNVHGLVELVDELGGITVKIPKRMHYRDRAAKLTIDLDEGDHTLNGTQAMGFVRFRHDALGDIGRVQRQEIFLRALLEKSLHPECWARVPKLVQIARNHVLTDLSLSQMMQVLTFARGVPKDRQHLVMLPGSFSGAGYWAVDEDGLGRVTALLMGQLSAAAPRGEIKLAIENASSNHDLHRKLSRHLSGLGYPVINTSGGSELYKKPQGLTRFIAERGTPADAAKVRSDLGECGEIVNASIGDIDSTVTVVAGDDLIPVLEAASSPAHRSR